MVAVGVADEDVRDAAGAGLKDGGEVSVVVGAGVEQGERAAGLGGFDEPGVGAVIGHRSRVRRDDAAYAGLHEERHAAWRHFLGHFPGAPSGGWP